MGAESILLTGATGYLAPYLMDAAAGMGDVVTTARGGGDQKCDLTDADAVKALVGKVAPAVIIHAAAYTDVDGCEADPAAADRANRTTVQNLVTAAANQVFFCYISTDQVYPDVTGPHREGDEAPVNVYGQTKFAGELAAARHGRVLIARSNFVGASRTVGRSSLDDFIRKSLSHGDPVTLFDDVLFSPLHAGTFASVLMEMIGRGVLGTYNFACRDGLSKADFALKVARHHGLQVECAVIGSSTDLPGRAERTLDLRMDPTKLEQTLGRSMPTLEEEISKL